MKTIEQLVRRRNERRARREGTIEWAIQHASTEAERNELMDLASAQGVFA